MNNIEILEWLNSQHFWLQTAASKILTNGVLSDADISELVCIIKESNEERTHKLRVGFPVINKIDSKNNIKLVSIGPVKGIDKFDTKKPLIFGPENLSVVYGPNGSGKSGFVRILKSISGKSNAKPLKSNVYASNPAKQSCMLKYTINGTDRGDVEWIANTLPISELSNIDIFDATNGNFYLENETETTYVPAELTLFTELVNVADRIARAFDMEQQKLVSTLPKMADKYSSTSYAKIYTALQFDTPQSKIDDILIFSSDNEKKLKSLQQRLLVVDPAEVSRKKRVIKTQIESIIATIHKYVEAISIQAITEIRVKSETAIQKRKAASEGSEVLTETAKLDGIG